MKWSLSNGEIYESLIRDRPNGSHCETMLGKLCMKVAQNNARLGDDKLLLLVDLRQGRS